MQLSRLRKNWETLGKADPLWAVLSDPEKKGGKWEAESFFRSGVVHIDDLLNEIRAVGFPLMYGTALDFGCGVGRLTQAMCKYFNKCYGVDISSSMLEHAYRYNQYGTACEYVLNASSHLHCFDSDSFDFIYSTIVLQHIPPAAGKRYIAEFLRVLKPNGLLIFQVPSTLRDVGTVQSGSGPDNSPVEQQTGATGKVTHLVSGAVQSRSSSKIESSDKPRDPSELIDMYGIPRDEVVDLISKAAGNIVQIQQYDCAGPHWFSFRYWVTKSARETWSPTLVRRFKNLMWTLRRAVSTVGAQTYNATSAPTLARTDQKLRTEDEVADNCVHHMSLFPPECTLNGAGYASYQWCREGQAEGVKGARSLDTPPGFVCGNKLLKCATVFA